MFVLFLSWDLEYTGLVTNFGPVPFIPWGPLGRVGRSKNIHNEKASTFHETLEVGVKDAVRKDILQHAAGNSGNTQRHVHMSQGFQVADSMANNFY